MSSHIISSAELPRLQLHQDSPHAAGYARNGGRCDESAVGGCGPGCRLGSVGTEGGKSGVIVVKLSLMAAWQRIALGFTLSVLLGEVILSLLSRHLWRLAGTPRPDHRLTIYLGIIERFLYTASLFIGRPEWVPV